MKTSEQINEIATSLSKAQGEMLGAKKGSVNPFFRSKYSDLSMVIEAINQPFANNNLCFVQAAEMNEHRVAVTTRIIHASGQWIESLTELPPTKNDAQGIGSSISYGKRYGLMALAGVPSVDDDAVAAVKHKVTPKKVTKANMSEVEKSACDNLFKMSESQDSLGIKQVWAELTEDEKTRVWAKLPRDSHNNIKQLLKVA